MAPFFARQAVLALFKSRLVAAGSTVTLVSTAGNDG